MTKRFSALVAVIAIVAGVVIAYPTFGRLINPAGSSGLSAITVNGNSGTGITVTSTGQLNVAASGTQLTLTSQTKYPIQFIIENPTTAEDDAVFVFNDTSTITRLFSVNKSLGDTVNFNWFICPSRNTATSSCPRLFTAYSTSSATTTPDDYPTRTAFASTSVPAGSVLRFLTSGTASSSQLNQTLFYTTP